MVEYLQKYSEANLMEFGESLDLFPENLQRKVTDLLTRSIDELDLDEFEAEQYIEEFIEDDSREELNALAAAINTSKNDVFNAVFQYSGWEIGDLVVSEDPELPHEIEISYLYDCNLNSDEVITNIAGSIDQKVPEFCAVWLCKVLDDIKSRYSFCA